MALCLGRAALMVCLASAVGSITDPATQAISQKLAPEQFHEHAQVIAGKDRGDAAVEAGREGEGGNAVAEVNRTDDGDDAAVQDTSRRRLPNLGLDPQDYIDPFGGFQSAPWIRRRMAIEPTAALPCNQTQEHQPAFAEGRHATSADQPALPTAAIAREGQQPSTTTPAPPEDNQTVFTEGLQGDAGDPGDRGPQGPDGIAVPGRRGDRGPRGLNGPLGRQGQPGPQGRVGPRGIAFDGKAEAEKLINVAKELLRQVDTIREAHDATSSLVMDNIRRVEKYLRMDESDIKRQQEQTMLLINQELMAVRLLRQAKSKQDEINAIIFGKHKRLDNYFEMIDQADADTAAMGYADVARAPSSANTTNTSNVTVGISSNGAEEGGGLRSAVAFLILPGFVFVGAVLYYYYKMGQDAKHQQEQKAEESGAGQSGGDYGSDADQPGYAAEEQAAYEDQY